MNTRPRLFLATIILGAALLGVGVFFGPGFLPVPLVDEVGNDAPLSAPSAPDLALADMVSSSPAMAAAVDQSSTAPAMPAATNAPAQTSPPASPVQRSEPKQARVVSAAASAGEGVVPDPVRGPAWPDGFTVYRTPAEILAGKDLADPAQRALAVGEMAEAEEVRYEAVLAKAQELDIPVRVEGPGQRVAILHDIRGTEPLYRVTQNRNAAISSAANLLYPAPYNLDGTGVKVGVWDAGAVRNTHREFNTTRVIKRNNVALDDHATHVAGTVGALGFTNLAKGMAPNVAIDSWDWNSDYAEMTSSGAATATGDSSKIPISNHSYGYNATISDMGRYNAESRTTDTLAVSMPYFLIFWAAGNEQDELTAKNGYQSITFNGLAKNIMTVGAVNDAVSGGARSPAAGTMSTFSSWGPCDDGRIKPDVVANGVTVYSPIDTSDSAYSSYGGTSMSTPSAAGSAALLSQLYAREFGGRRLPASLLKALLIHTADDLGTPGPDYKFGWGLINVKAAADVILSQKQFPGTPKLIENTLTSSVRSRSHVFQWDGVSPIRATLSWTDPAGTAQADNSRVPNLVHNLDLKITAPDGTTVYQPFVMPFVGTWSDASMALAATRGKNNVDNTEQVLLASPVQAGSYTVTVSLDGSLTTSAQAYSLVVTGGATASVPVVVADGGTLVAESCGAGNGVPDPGEIVTMALALKNNGTASTTNLTATLLDGNGVTALTSGPQSYGVLPAGGAAVARSFEFVTEGECGATVSAVLALQDGATSLGTVAFEFVLGIAATESAQASNPASMTIPDSGASTPYPSIINVAGRSGVVSKVAVTLVGLSHTYPGDLDVLLVGPDGARVGLLGRVGGGTDAVNATITFDDEATASVGSSITSGIFRPTGVSSSLPSPAPAVPYGAALSPFNGGSANGNWALYVVDRAAQDAGSISGGWRLDITTVQSSCCGDGGQPPVVTLNTPTGGTVVASGQPLTLSATATASGELEDGSPRVIDRVEFLVDGQIVAAGSVSPYTATWTPPAAGTYALAARAWDNGNLSTTTVPSTVAVLVGNGAPSIAAFSPASGAAGESVTITGVNFANVSAVRFNGVNATAYTLDSATQITAVAPAGTTSGPLSVVTPLGVATSSTSFTIVESPVLISQIYGAGGNNGAVYNADYVELHNRSGSAVNLAGWSLQYSSASGTSWSTKVDLVGTIAPGGYFLVRLSGGSTGAALPTPDLTGAIRMSATQGKVALRNTTALFMGSSPVGQSGLQDFVGFGAANAYEGSAAAPSPSATTAIFRAGGGAMDTGDNGADFSAGPPAPRNSASSAATPVIDSASTAVAVVGQSFNYQITASNNPNTFAATGLPSGLNIVPATGLISGVPAQTGGFAVTLTASNAAGSGQAVLNLTINASGGTSYLVDFEDGSKAGYAAGTDMLNGLTWSMTEVLIGTEQTEFKNGLRSARLRGYGTSEMVMLNDKLGGIGTISFQHRRYGSDTQIPWIVEYSTNAGGVWTEAGRFTAGAEVATFSAAVNISGPARVRIRAGSSGSSNRRANIDNLLITDAAAGPAPEIALSGQPSVQIATYGLPSLTQTSFLVAGSDLQESITITPPTGFELSLSEDGTTGYAPTAALGGAGELAPTVVFIRLAAGMPVGFYSGDITCTTAGAAPAVMAMPESEVRPRGLNITALDQSKPFGESLPLGPGQTAFSASGLADGETIGSVTLAANGGTAANDAAGVYTLTPSAAAGGAFNPANYSIFYFPGTLTVQGVSFGDWSAGLSDASPGADPDGNGLVNLAEYFFGLQPGGNAAGAMVIGAPTATSFHLDYRRSKSLNGVSGRVVWKNDLNTSNWSADGVTDELVSDHGDYEIRRATAPVLPGERQKFLRLEVGEN